ncbi:MAG TPA: HAD family hydrolase [Lentisphaeria bacterium]|nr:HAD family hydrolase [Lentisphaeria bacterium]
MYTKTVREFTTACQPDLPTTPTPLSTDGVAFIRQMVIDELDELAEAETPVDQADALVDAIYYICDCAVRHGMNLDPLFRIVHQANMGKVVDGRVLRREDGKIMKPANWQPPEPQILAEMQRQSEHGSFS